MSKEMLLILSAIAGAIAIALGAWAQLKDNEGQTLTKPMKLAAWGQVATAATLLIGVLKDGLYP